MSTKEEAEAAINGINELNYPGALKPLQAQHAYKTCRGDEQLHGPSDALYGGGDSVPGR